MLPCYLRELFCASFWQSKWWGDSWLMQFGSSPSRWPTSGLYQSDNTSHILSEHYSDVFYTTGYCWNFTRALYKGTIPMYSRVWKALGRSQSGGRIDVTKQHIGQCVTVWPRRKTPITSRRGGKLGMVSHGLGPYLKPATRTQDGENPGATTDYALPLPHKFLASLSYGTPGRPLRD